MKTLNLYKVVHGEISWLDSANETHTRKPFIDAHTVVPIAVNPSDGRYFVAPYSILIYY